MAAEQSAPPAGAIDRVQLDVSARAFVDKLPFDVPFFIVGSPPPRTTLIRTDVSEEENGGKKTCALPYHRATAHATGDFAVYIERRLCAQRRYHFRFQFLKTPEPEEIGRIREFARGRFDLLLRDLPGNITTELGTQIHNELTEVVRRAAEPGSWESKPGGLFDISGGRQPLEPLLVAINGVTSVQAERGNVLKSITEGQDVLHARLGTLVSDPALVALRKVPAKVTADPEVAPIWEKAKTGLELMRTQEPSLRLLAEGGNSTPVGQQWSDLAPRISSYRDTLAALLELQTLLRHVIDPNSLRSKFEPVLTATMIDGLIEIVAPGRTLAQAISSANSLMLNVTLLDNGLTRRTAALTALANRIDLLLLQELFVVGSTFVDGATPANWYVSMDGGFLYAGSIGTGALFVGTNIYFRPVNKSASLSEVSSFGRRFAVTAGITLQSIADSASRPVRFDFMANQSLVFGMGYRITPSMRLGGGALVFREADRNPNVSSRNVTTTWYAAASVDLDIAKTIGGNGGPFSSK